ncbi:hypothetical protein [Mixta intestinalis]|nr:hypothetical protein [Mixta intestinalis]
MSIKWLRSDSVCRQRKFILLMMTENIVFLLFEDGRSAIRSRRWLE